MDDNNHVYVEAILDDSQREISDSAYKNTSGYSDSQNQEIKPIPNESVDKNSAVWTTSATLTLLKLYEAKMETLETPKKKTGMWIAISENLKNFNIEMTPNQVRWKINALTKKYKQCLELGQQKSFKYFKEMENILGQYSDDNDSYTISELIQRKKELHKNQLTSSLNEAASSIRSNSESKAMIELRKIRLANRIESVRSQSKIQLEKQWLEYLRRQEEQKILRDEIFERTLKLREEELELRRKELEIKESLELKKLQLREREQEEILQIEREKCEMLKKMLTHKKFDSQSVACYITEKSQLSMTY